MLFHSIGVCKCADDCTVYEAVFSSESSKVQVVFDSMQAWSNNNKMIINSTKIKEMWINFKDTPCPDTLVSSEGEQIERVTSFKILGFFYQDNLKWTVHVNEINKKASKRLFHLRECRKAGLPLEVGVTTYCSRQRPLLEYA